MPTFNNYMNLVYVNLGFIAQIACMFYFKSIIEIKKNWPLYRCNPPYWIFSDNISEDFTYCVQNTQMNLMGYLLQPLTYVMSSLTSMGGDFSNSINMIRNMISVIRGFITNAVQNVFGVFLNLVTEFQRMTINIKDMVGKTIGIIVTLLYVLDGSQKTISSAWNGPSGQLVRSIGKVSCFHPETKLRLKDGTIVDMKDIKVGSILEDGSSVFSVMKIVNNSTKENYNHYYRIRGGLNINGETKEYIYVTGDHYVFDKEQDKFIKVKYYRKAEKQTVVKSEYFSCLITNSGKIPIGNEVFWDWEDDEINEELSWNTIK